MRLGSIALAAIVCAGPVADVSASSERPKLTGFADIRFGMSETDLQSTVAVVKSENVGQEDPDIAWYDGTNPTDVGGAPFVLRIMVERGLVRRIGLARLEPAQNSSCKADFDALVAYVSAQYGPPDEVFRRGTKESYRASYAFEDHAVIQIMSGLNSDGRYCIDSIMHYAPSILTQ